MNSKNNFFITQESMKPGRVAPILSVGIIGWLKHNLFSSWVSSVFTLVSLLIIWLVIKDFLDWALFTADFAGESRIDCTNSGACWAWVDLRIYQFLYGFYPREEVWRVNLTLILLVPALLPVLFHKIPKVNYLRLFAIIYPFIAAILLNGGFGLSEIPTSKFGGFTLNITIGITGIFLSLPFGILLALGRRSKMVVVRLLSTAFIEIFRGVPLITLLFVAAILFPIFMPSSFSLDLLIRVIVVVTLFSSAYMAEVIRGGLQAIPKGQYEAAQALGMRYWKMLGLIILPQALKISIPGIVNTFIGLFKDTTLVIVIGLFDILNIGNSMVSNPDWMGLSKEVHIVTALFFFVACFSMSRYSIYLEQLLNKAKN